MSKIQIVVNRKSQYAPIEERDYILRVSTGAVILEIVEFEWDSIVSYDLLGKTHVIRHARFPIRQLWNAADAFGKPSKAILKDGSSFWIMRAFCDRETGKIIKLGAGNSSEFICAEREI
uniref:Uncharacterized protein n=1 Tax=Ochrobactrum phage ORM_20 TaxID=2985243 RepID=A0A9N6WU67_9VIRU|nr:hypothetical protein ORM20_00240 [Ochrobactrum phage ORM_20]